VPLWVIIKYGPTLYIRDTKVTENGLILSCNAFYLVIFNSPLDLCLYRGLPIRIRCVSGVVGHVVMGGDAGGCKFWWGAAFWCIA
jgi:hypothetical protein